VTAGTNTKNLIAAERNQRKKSEFSAKKRKPKRRTVQPTTKAEKRTLPRPCPWKGGRAGGTAEGWGKRRHAPPEVKKKVWDIKRRKKKYYGNHSGRRRYCKL